MEEEALGSACCTDRGISAEEMSTGDLAAAETGDGGDGGGGRGAGGSSWEGLARNAKMSVSEGSMDPEAL